MTQSFGKKAAWLAAAVGISLGACHCDDDVVSGLKSALEVQPLVVDFGDVPLGVRRTSAVSVRNVGESPLVLARPTFAGDSAFMILDPIDVVPLPAAATTAVRINAEPARIGTATATLSLVTDDASIAPVEVRLVVTGVEPPPCDDRNVCTNDAFDVSVGECRHTFADGTECFPRDRCVIDAVCARGVCLGASKTCSDGSSCTRDLCRQTDGLCVFAPDPAACDDENPCTADSCDDSGCVHEALANGIACDDDNPCTNADTCFSGECRGRGVADGGPCDDQDSCTISDTCLAGFCRGRSIIDATPEGSVVFTFPLVPWPSAFLHRREVSMGDDGTLFLLDHLPLFDPEPGLTHVVTTLRQCGTPHYEFSYRPPDSHVLVSSVRREMQLAPEGALRLVVGIRQLVENGFLPQTTTYLIDPEGAVKHAQIQVLGGETGRALLPDGSSISGVIWPLNDAPTIEDNQQNLVVVREDSEGRVLWRHERTSSLWSEFLGVAGPRVLFGASQAIEGRTVLQFGALDFNTGQPVWTVPVSSIAKEMALSTELNLGVARIGVTFADSQLLGVEIIEGREVFRFPKSENAKYVPRTDPVIAPDGRILVLMQRNEVVDERSVYPVGIDWVELAPDGTPLSTTELPLPPDFDPSRREDDSYPTVAGDGVAYVGYAQSLWAIEPGGTIRWTLTSTLPIGFTGTVPLLRDDGVMLVSEGDRRILGVRTNGGQMTDAGWSSFRHDNRRTNYTP